MTNISQYIEHTNLKPLLVDQDIYKLVEEAKSHKFYGICIPPFWVKKASRELQHSDVRIVTVAGFPLGYNMTETKLEEMRLAIRDGAHELDLVMNISAFKSNMPWVKIEIAKSAALAHAGNCLLKIIVETAYLSKKEIEKACKICADAGADFVKTSTGFAPEGATLENILLMRSVLPKNVGIKASGGIKNYLQAKALIEAGADRIGTSSGVEIVDEEALQKP